MITAKRPYPIPSRTRKSSSFASMVLHGRLCGRVDGRRLFFYFCRYFAHLRRQLRRSCGRNVRQYAPTRIQACFLASASNYRQKYTEDLFFCLRYFARLRTWLCRSGCGNARECAPTRIRLVSRYLHQTTEKNTDSLRMPAYLLCKYGRLPELLPRSGNTLGARLCSRCAASIRRAFFSIFCASASSTSSSLAIAHVSALMRASPRFLASA